MDYSYSPVSPYGKAYEGHRTYAPRSKSMSKSANKLFDYLSSKESKYIHISILTTSFILLLFTLYTTYVYTHDYTADELNNLGGLSSYITWTKGNKWFVGFLWVLLVLLITPSGLWMKKNILSSSN
jgi:hypothetical protein